MTASVVAIAIDEDEYHYRQETAADLSEAVGRVEGLVGLHHVALHHGDALDLYIG